MCAMPKQHPAAWHTAIHIIHTIPGHTGSKTPPPSDEPLWHLTLWEVLKCFDTIKSERNWMEWVVLRSESVFIIQMHIIYIRRRGPDGNFQYDMGLAKKCFLWNMYVWREQPRAVTIKGWSEKCTTQFKTSRRNTKSLNASTAGITSSMTPTIWFTMLLKGYCVSYLQKMWNSDWWLVAVQCSVA